MTEPSEVQTAASHGGILFPLDMFRPTMLASIVGEAFVAKARNVLDAKLELTRHPQSQLILMRLHGSIVEDPATFWRENADLALVLSQVMPRQVFLYYASDDPKRQGFLVGQQGQALAGDDADDATLPAGTPDNEWPVARLAGQLRCSMQELASGFEGGPRIELSVMEPTGDDRELLMILAEPPEGIDADGNPIEDPASSASSAGASAASSASPATAPSMASASHGGPSQATADPDASPMPHRKSPGELQAEAEADRKRRAAEKDAEAAERQALIKQAQDGLSYFQDELGVVVAVEAELSDTDVLSPFVVRRVSGDLPQGLPTELTTELQGKRVDVAVKVDFLSEVLFEGSPLDKGRFAEHADTVQIDGLEFQRLAVLAPRLGAGTLLRRAKAGVFVSREPTSPLPDALILSQSGVS